MSEETSVHWHGLLLPNFYDGVPYLNTPPNLDIRRNMNSRQSGTYWYHSHSMLQEQSGVFGSLSSQKKNLTYDKDLVLMLSDWTNENQ
jgi:FtsP/CotA-like multicopper oxidase with cupredoxin domain